MKRSIFPSLLYYLFCSKVSFLSCDVFCSICALNLALWEWTKLASWPDSSQLLSPGRLLSYHCLIIRSYLGTMVFTSKSLSKTLIFASTNPQYENRLFIELPVQYIKFQAQSWGEHVVYRNCFWHSEQFLYTTCSLHVLQKEELLTKIYLYFKIIVTIFFQFFQKINEKPLP